MTATSNEKPKGLHFKDAREPVESTKKRKYTRLTQLWYLDIKAESGHHKTVIIDSHEVEWLSIEYIPKDDVIRIYYSQILATNEKEAPPYEYVHIDVLGVQGKYNANKVGKFVGTVKLPVPEGTVHVFIRREKDITTE